MAKQYTTVSDLLRDVAPDAEVRVAAEQRISSRTLIKHLLTRRATRGLSQKDIAEKLNCVQSRVSKLENSRDDDLRLGDIREYAKAVDCKFVVGIAPCDMKPVDAVKCHVFAIKKHMDDLAALANGDEKIAQGVAQFFAELFFNFARLFGDSVKRLPHGPNDTPYLHFECGDSSICQGEEEQADEPCMEVDCPTLTTF